MDEYIPEVTMKPGRPHNLQETAELMASNNYKERFFAEYWQTKIRYEKLKKFNTRIEAAHRVNGAPLTPDFIHDDLNGNVKHVEEPKHDCPANILEQQQRAMGEYLHILEVRAVIEGIELEPEF